MTDQGRPVLHLYSINNIQEDRRRLENNDYEDYET